jgi:tetratricopeptide (TPR) repeat protein
MPGSDSSSSSSSSSSSDGYSSSGDGAASPDAPKDEPKPDAPRTLGRRRLPKVEKLQTDEDRVEEDMKVARFYEGKGDLNAAYMRLQDAVKSLPNDSESHYALARMAQKMNKRDEAIAEYSAYIKLEPDGENVSKAQKALDQLQSK